MYSEMRAGLEKYLNECSDETYWRRFSHILSSLFVIVQEHLDKEENQNDPKDQNSF